MTLLFFFLPIFIFASSRAEETIRFQAANTSIVRDVKHGLHFANFVKHQFKYLNVTPFKSLLVSNKKKCQVLCVKDLPCLSLNVGVYPNSNGQFKCELLATDMLNSSTNMTDNVNYHHYSIKTFCGNKPCKNHGTCKPDPSYKTNAYSCECQCPYYGKHCEKVLVYSAWSAWTKCSYYNSCSFSRYRNRTYPFPEVLATECPKTPEKETQTCIPTIIPGCASPLGMEDGRIQDSQITATDSLADYPPRNARLNKFIGTTGCWVGNLFITGSIGRLPSLIIDLGSMMNITMIAIQGCPRPEDSQYNPSSSYLKYSTDNTAWTYYPSSGQCTRKLFRTCTSNDGTTVTIVIPEPFQARYVSFYQNQVKRGLRVELYGCQV